MHSFTLDDSAVYDLVGLGFGPANLAIAGAIVERRASTLKSAFPIKSVLFIEKHDRFRWHPGMLLPDARMQISFMKDLATLRNPRSPITFISYLHSQDRLVSFINRGSTIPSRKEYADYLSWAANYVQSNGVDVLYGNEVIKIRRGKTDTVEVYFRNSYTGKVRVVRARDIVISPGGAPRIPEPLTSIADRPQVIHSSAYATSIDHILRFLAVRPRPLRLAIIGSGQSAAEVTLDLRERLGPIPCGSVNHELDMIIRKGSLKPSDDSPFANEIFDPSSTDTWFHMPSEQIRATTLAEYKSTNYGVVNPRTLEILHEAMYNQKLDQDIAKRTSLDSTTHPHINILPYTSILSSKVVQRAISASTTLFSSHEGHIPNTDHTLFSILTQNLVSNAVLELKYDAVICATGYQRSSWIDLLKESDIGEYFGLRSGSTSVELLPLSAAFTAPLLETPPPSTSTCPPTLLDVSSLPSTDMAYQHRDTVYISRNYRLLPRSREQFKPRVYLQGVEETTHGLSDTLLSVLGVRAGDVVGDICEKDILEEDIREMARL